MPRRRLSQGNGEIFHVTNRSVRRVPIFCDDRDYRAFQKVLVAALERVPTRLIGFCVMPNHWHLVLWPRADELSRFMHRLTLMHSKRWHLARRVTGTGALYQGPYRAFSVYSHEALLRVMLYVEQNPVRAGLVYRAESWQWSSLWTRCNESRVVPLSEWPIAVPEDWLDRVNRRVYSTRNRV